MQMSVRNRKGDGESKEESKPLIEKKPEFAGSSKRAPFKVTARVPLCT